MHRRYLLVTVLVVVALIAAALPAQPTKAQTKTITLAFIPGVVDPFYQTMQVGVEQAVADFNATGDFKVNLVTQIPKTWNVSEQTPILNALSARKDINALITAAVDKDQMVPALEAFDKSGVPVISVDTFIGNGDYVNGPVKFPLSYIGSDNTEGGRIACDALANAIGKKGKVFIQSTNKGVSTVDQREQGCKEALAKYPDIKLVGVEYCLDDASKAQAQTTAVLQREKDLAGIFGLNVYSFQGAGTAVVNAGLKGAVQLVAFDATKQAIDMLKDGTVTLVIAQKPYDMGFLGVFYSMANARGVSSIPKRIPTGYAVINAKNMTDPNVSRFFYK
jgi:ribose transport system substrate-binding protein